MADTRRMLYNIQDLLVLTQHGKADCDIAGRCCTQDCDSLAKMIHLAQQVLQQHLLPWIDLHRSLSALLGFLVLVGFTKAIRTNRSSQSSKDHFRADCLIGLSEFPLPLGPEGFPVIGNLLDMPSNREWITHAEWKDKYGQHDCFVSRTATDTYTGDVVHLNVLGQSIIYLCSQSAVWELLEKRSSIYSDRPPFRLLTDPTLCVWPVESEIILTN